MARSAEPAQGGLLHGYPPAAPDAGGYFAFTRLMVPEKVNSGRSPDFSTPRRKISERAEMKVIGGIETRPILVSG